MSVQTHTLMTPLIQAGVSTGPDGHTLVAPWLNGWVNFQNGLQWAGFWKDSDGICHLRGVVKGGIGGYGPAGFDQPNAIFRLPAGYRPGGVERFAQPAFPGWVKGVGSQIAIPPLAVSTGGSTAPAVVTAPPDGVTWVDVLSDSLGGYVVPYLDATVSGSWVSLSGISFFADH